MIPWSRVGADLPAVTVGEPLLSSIRRHLDTAGRLTEGGHRLPDDEPLDSGLRFAPGMFDAVIGHDVDSDDSVRTAQEIAEMVVQACRRPTRRRLRSLHEALVEADTRAIVDHLMDELIRLQHDGNALCRIGFWLASTSPNRGPVKIGMTMIGATDLEKHIDVVRTLGAHDEFTLYAANAMRNGLADPDSELWGLAASVDGWGRIHCVGWLQNTKDPQIRSWLLREGYKNSIMNEYTAFVAAETGGLLVALEQDPVDRGLLTAAGEILSALTRGGPAADMDDYADGANAIERYLTLMRSRAESLGDYRAVAAIRDFLGDDERSTDDLPGWSVSRREALHAACLEILCQPHWRDRVTALLTPDTPDRDFETAREIARDLGIDTFEETLRRIEQDPFGAHWYHAWLGADTDRARLLAELVRTRLPLAEIASGPADALGFGPEFRAHFSLEWSLQALRDHPGIGGDLLIIGLQSPVTRNRNMALNAFQQWPAESWPSEARAFIETAAATDPNEHTRELAGRVRRGEPSDDV